MLTIALLGSIPKGDEARAQFVDWKQPYLELVQEKLPDARILYGDAISDNVGPALVVGHDLWMIREADVVIVDAPKKVGAGTAQEMVIAKYFGKLVVAVIPPDSHHRRSGVTFDGVTEAEWIHPFLLESSDYVAGSPEEAIEWLAQGSLPQPKQLAHFDELIAQFEAQFPDLVARYRHAGTHGARTMVESASR